MIKETLGTERDIWATIRGGNKRSLRKQYWRDFRTLFPLGHSESIRDLVGFMGSRIGQKKIARNDDLRYLRDVHPRAFQLLEKYGQDYRPKFWHRPPPIEPEKGKCFKNAWVLMSVAETRRNNGRKNALQAVYVEGVTLGLCLPMLHAWNARSIDRGTAVDWTLYALCPWNRYLGIPLTSEEHKIAMRCMFPHEPAIGPMLHQKNFVRVESYLQEVCSQRNESP